MQKLILHIPHSSTSIPSKRGFVIDDTTLNAELLKLTDWYTDDLFHSIKDDAVIADFSRLFCDPERFADDSKEIMSKYGMGVLYEKLDNGEQMRVVTEQLKKIVLQDYYWKHHGRLNELTRKHLKQFGKATIIDCHSFSNIPFQRDLDQSPNRPDFNIGTDRYHTPRQLITLSTEYFGAAGFSLGVDWPYSGSMVPVEYHRKDKRVQSIMLEVNRKLYLKGRFPEKSDRYGKIKNVTKGFIELIRSAA